jgi:hypothetical protein
MEHPVPRVKNLPVWISTAKLAELLDVHPKTIKKWIRGGQIPEEMIRRTPGGDLRFDRNRVEEILRPVDRTKLSLLAVAVIVLLTACGGSSLDQAMCNDLRATSNMMQIQRPSDMSPERFAGHVYTATKNACPEQLDRVHVQTFLENWGYR